MRITKKTKVLIFPGGTEIGLEIWRSLKDCENIRLYSANANVSNHASYVFERHFLIPGVHDARWLHSLNQVITEHAIDFVFPAHDDTIVALAQNTQRVNAKIIGSSLETCLIARSKSQTYRILASIVPVPEVQEAIERIKEYPVFAKPDKGQGSRYAHIVHGKKQLVQVLRQNDREYIIMEYLPGEEYTIDCFSDRDMGLLFCRGRQRIRTKAGISMNSRPIQDSIFVEYANAISKKLDFHGAWFFQLKRDRHGVLKLLEVAPRIAGTMAMHRVQGVNFALLSIYEQQRVHIEILVNKADVEIDRALINRYKHSVKYSTVYVDFDDTLIIDGSINTDLVKFLFQCINKGIRMVMLTKHAGDINQALRGFRLTELFDEIIHLNPIASKADFIRESDAILIDDSFSERKAVNKRLGILTFDPSMVEMLIDERR